MNTEVFVRLFRGRGDARGSWQGPAIREPLTPEHFARHLRGADASSWFGVYNVIGDRCSWGCVDIDTDDLPLARNISVALRRQLIPSWIEQTTRGFHVWVFPADQLVSADIMRRALTAGCRAIGYQPREVFPKQARAASLGNYVRLPLNGALASPRLSETRRFVDEPELEEMDGDRAATVHLVRVAAYAPRSSPQPVEFAVDFEAGLEYDEVARSIGGPAYRLWRNGPWPGNDRSTALAKLAHRLYEQNVEASVAYSLVASADARWGKGFLDRGQPGVEIMRKIISNAYGRTA